MRIEKKIHPKFFQLIIDGVKSYDLRLADFDINVGDVLVLREWNSDTKEYTGRVLEKSVTYISKTKDSKIYSKEDVEKFGYQIISFK